MAVGPIQFNVSTNPIDGLNARLRAMGRAEIVTELKSTPALASGGHYHDITYIARNGGRRTYSIFQGPMDSANDLVSNLLAHINAVELTAKEAMQSATLADTEYQQYLDDHKAMTLGTLFGENRFPRARERAFLDFRNQASSRTRYESFDYRDPPSGFVKKILDAYLTHHLPGLSSIKCDASATQESEHAIISLHSLVNWEHCKTIRIPLSCDTPWFTAAQQARDTLREWIDAAAQKKSETATAGNDYIVSIWDINYPKARVEYHEGIEQVRSTWGFTQGIYKASAKIIGIPRAVDENGPFDITLKYTKGDIVVLRNCTWVADGEVQCERIETNGKSVLVPSESTLQKVAAKQQIPKGAMVNSDGEVVGKATPAPGVAYLNGVPVCVMTNIEYGDATVRLNTDGEGRVTTTAQQVREAIDRSAINVPSVDEIKQRFVNQIHQDGHRYSSGGALDSVAASMASSIHDTYRAINSAYGQNSLDNAAQIGDTVTKETASMPGIYDPVTPIPLRQRATAEAIEVAYRTAAIKLPELVRKQLVKRMAAKGAKSKSKPSQARLSLAEDMLSGDEGALIVAGILSLALSASPEFIKSKMPWLDLDRLAKELRLNVETKIACAVADMLGMYLDGALEALKEAFGGSQQLLLAEGSKSDESALFNGVPKAETVRV